MYFYQQGALQEPSFIQQVSEGPLRVSKNHTSCPTSWLFWHNSAVKKYLWIIHKVCLCYQLDVWYVQFQDSPVKTAARPNLISWNHRLCGEQVQCCLKILSELIINFSLSATKLHSHMQSPVSFYGPKSFGRWPENLTQKQELIQVSESLRSCFRQFRF